MNKLLVLNLEEINDKKINNKENEQNEISQNPFLFQSPTIRSKRGYIKYSALLSQKNLSSNKQISNKHTEADLSYNPYCLSETNTIFHENAINRDKLEIKCFEKNIINKPKIKEKKKLVIKCLEASIKILNKISKEYIKSTTYVQPKLLMDSQDYTQDKEILAESKKRIEVYNSIIKNIKDNFLEIRAKFNKKLFVNLKSHDNSLDNEEVNEEGCTNIKDHGLMENAGDSIQEYTIPLNKGLHEDYDSSNLPEYIIQEDTVNKPVTLFSKFNNKLSTIDIDLDNDLLVENTIQQFDLTVTKKNSHFYTKDNIKINYDNDNCFFFRDNKKDINRYFKSKIVVNFVEQI